MRIFVDVDGTMTTEDRRGAPPSTEMIDRVKALIAAGHAIVVWSQRGKRYARHFCEEHGIKAEAYMGKPAMFVDDWPSLRRTGIPTVSPKAFLAMEIEGMEI